MPELALNAVQRVAPHRDHAHVDRLQPARPQDVQDAGRDLRVGTVVEGEGEIEHGGIRRWRLSRYFHAPGAGAQHPDPGTLRTPGPWAAQRRPAPSSY